jgi:hypothetical protein
LLNLGQGLLCKYFQERLANLVEEGFFKLLSEDFDIIGCDDFAQAFEYAATPRDCLFVLSVKNLGAQQMCRTQVL